MESAVRNLKEGGGGEVGGGGARRKEIGKREREGKQKWGDYSAETKASCRASSGSKWSNEAGVGVALEKWRFYISTTVNSALSTSVGSESFGLSARKVDADEK